MNVNELIKQSQKLSGATAHLDRMYAVKELAKLPVDPKIDKALIEALEDEYAEVVRAAVRGLAHRLDEVAIRNAVQYVADYHADWTAMSFAQDALAAFDAAKAATEVTETEPAEVIEVADAAVNTEVQPTPEVIIENSETNRQREALSRLNEVAYRHYSEIAIIRDLYRDICNNKFKVPLWLPNTEYATLRKHVVTDEKTRYGSVNFPPHGIRDYASEREFVLSLFSEWITRSENRNLAGQVGMKPYRVDPIMITEYDDAGGAGVRIYNPCNGDNHIFQITYSSTLKRDGQRAGFFKQAQARFEAAKRDPQGFFNND